MTLPLPPGSMAATTPWILGEDVMNLDRTRFAGFLSSGHAPDTRVMSASFQLLPLLTYTFQM